MWTGILQLLHFIYPFYPISWLPSTESHNIHVDMLMIHYWWCCKLIIIKQMQILSDYWVIDLRMTFMMMMIYVTYSTGKSTANSCSPVAFSAKTTHWTSLSHSILMVLHLTSHPTNKIFGLFSWSSMNFLQDWGKNIE